MSDLHQLKCEACQVGVPAVTSSEAEVLLADLPLWQMERRDGIDQLEKCYRFKNFKQAWAFADQVAELAEAEFHHPTITLEWGKVTVCWWTHAIGGLHRNDFICAAKTEKLLSD